jgi:hypothetical protein
MARQQNCADRLFLVGEMLETASQYIRLCKDDLEQQDKLLIELARDQITPLRRRAVELGKELSELDARLRRTVADLGSKEPSKLRQTSS